MLLFCGAGKVCSAAGGETHRAKGKWGLYRIDGTPNQLLPEQPGPKCHVGHVVSAGNLQASINIIGQLKIPDPQKIAEQAVTCCTHQSWMFFLSQPEPAANKMLMATSNAAC